MAGAMCTQCGASTPLPEDLRVPSFTCRYCGTALSTETYAGLGAVRVDEMRAFFDAVVEAPAGGTLPSAPVLVRGGGGVRETPCVHCGATLAVPLDITVPTIRCEACGKTEPVGRYVSDAERLQLDMARQVAGNEAVAELVRTGLACPRCGAHNKPSVPVSVQIECASCRHAILLSDFVPADAIDRARLKQSVLALKESLVAREAASARTTRLAVIAVVIAVVIVALAAVLLSRG